MWQNEAGFSMGPAPCQGQEQLVAVHPWYTPAQTLAMCGSTIASAGHIRPGPSAPCQAERAACCDACVQLYGQHALHLVGVISVAPLTRKAEDHRLVPAGVSSTYTAVRCSLASWQDIWAKRLHDRQGAGLAAHAVGTKAVGW
jgi:hypothetical protein